MVTPPRYLNITASGDTDRASIEDDRKQQPGKQSYYKLNTEIDDENKTVNHATITLDEAARLLNISTATVRLWTDMGVLHTSLSLNKHMTLRRADILTFLPEENTLLPAVTRTNCSPFGTRLESQERNKLAEINVQAIAELTKQSVFEIDHLGGTVYNTSS